MVVIFGDEVEDALKEFLENSRYSQTPLPGHENATVSVHAAQNGSVCRL